MALFSLFFIRIAENQPDWKGLLLMSEISPITGLQLELSVQL